jgi:hypothetical protein
VVDEADGNCYIGIVIGIFDNDREVFTMQTMNVMLGTINDVKDFVSIVSRYDFDVDLVSGRYAVDAKSIMGIFSLDLSKSIKVEIHAEDSDAFYDEVKRFEI